MDVFRLLERGRILVRARLRRGSFFSGGGDLSAKRLRRQLKRAVETTVDV